MQTRYSDENSVCLSVCLSVTRVIPDKTVEKSVQIFIPYERTFILVFWEEERLNGIEFQVVVAGHILDRFQTAVLI